MPVVEKLKIAETPFAGLRQKSPATVKSAEEPQACSAVVEMEWGIQFQLHHAFDLAESRILMRGRSLFSL